MRVIVDTSVWCHLLGKAAPSEDPQVRRLVSLMNEGQSIAVVGPIVQEVLQGIRNEQQFARVEEQLDAFPLLPLDREDYVAAAQLRIRCLARGVQAGTVDLQIAVACLRHDCALLTCDADFGRIAECCELHLL